MVAADSHTQNLNGSNGSEAGKDLENCTVHSPSSRPDPLELSTTGRSRVTQFIARHKPVVADVNVLTPDIALQTLGFSLLMGLVGGFIHA